MSILQQFQNINGNTPLSRRTRVAGTFPSRAYGVLALGAGNSSPAVGNIAYYTCTMHPFVRSQDPEGKCPICGMAWCPC